MRRALAAALAGAAVLAVPASAAAPPRVQTMVVGPRGVIWGAHTVTAGVARVRVGGRPCRVRAGSALATLAAAQRRGGPGFVVTGDCTVPYVPRIGRFAAAGADGWEYKVGNVAPRITAGAPRRGIDSGARVLWFWCRLRPGGCQRTLVVRPASARVTGGARLAVTVTGYDDDGRGWPVAGASLRLGAARARTDRHGRALLTAPSGPGLRLLSATRAGLVPSFPERVSVR